MHQFRTFALSVLGLLLAFVTDPHTLAQFLSACYHSLANIFCTGDLDRKHVDRRRALLSTLCDPNRPWRTLSRITGYLARTLNLPCLDRKDKDNPKPLAPTHFPFFQLPLELRHQIYHHASGPADITHVGRIGAGLTYTPAKSYFALTTQPAPAASQTSTSSSANISYALADNGLIAYHGRRPTATLLCVCKQFFAEATAHFLSTTAFEVQPLNPHDVAWRLDTTLTRRYDTRPLAVHVSAFKVLRVRIEVAKNHIGRKAKLSLITGGAAQASNVVPMSLDFCTTALRFRAQILAQMIAALPAVSVLEVCWVDEFPACVGAKDLKMRTEVLKVLASIAGVSVRIKEFEGVEIVRRALSGALNPPKTIVRAQLR